MESRTAVITGVESELEIRRVSIPDLAPGAILVKVAAATLCGTDAHRWQGHTPSVDKPFVPGHETCGTIVDMRGPVRTLLAEPLKIGDRIVASYSHCGHCYFCRVSRQTTLCKETIYYGAWSPEKLLGGCSEYHVYPPGASFVLVPDGVSSPLAASSACALRTVFHGFEQLGAIASYESALILGSGPLGLYAAAVARDRGAKTVLVAGAPAARLDVARAFGADHVLDVTQVADVNDRIAWVLERTGGRGADVVFNCANSPAFVDALEMARRGARVVNIGSSGGPPIPLPPALLFKQIAIKTVAMAEARHFYEAIEFLATRAGEFPFDRMLSNTYPLERTADALRAMVNLTEIKPIIVA